MTGTNDFTMPVAPINYGGGGFGGGDGAWWILILLLALGGGWNGGWGGNGGGFVGADVQRGFDQSALMSGITGLNNSVTAGFGDVQTALCSGFSGVEIAANARQIADLQQAFATQTAITGGLTNLQAQLSQCCCDNRMATVQTQNIIQNEAAATRSAISGSTQALLDKLCALEIDAKNDKIASLERELTAANTAAQITAQTATLVADNARQTAVLEALLTPAAV